MTSHNKTLQLLASKLGLSEEEKVLSKAAEFERLLQTKTIAGTNLSDTSKVVICLDLAAGIYGVELDVKTAVKYSGLKPVAYTSNRKTVENLLELNTGNLTVPMLCVTLQCSSVQETAEKILEEYQKQSKVEVDLSMPQYVCMAVFQACRINKVKVSKVKINEKCRLKPAQWAKLEADWASFVNEKFNVIKNKRGRPAKNVANGDENLEMEVDSKDDDPTESEIEPYEAWKQRMLEEAHEELKQLEKKPKEISLKSPRKSSLKDVPKRFPQKQNRGTPQKETRGTPQKETRGTPQKETRSTPQKETRSTLQKEPRGTSLKETRGTPQKETRGTPQKETRVIPQRETKTSQMEISSGTPLKEATRDTPQKELLGILGDMSPRRSPRKTPQKFSPYKTPSKSNGVRLLFPTHL